MASRLQLQAQLEIILGSRNVYFQPPESMRLTYPCIVYYLDAKDTKKADDRNYQVTNRYSVIVIDPDPDNEQSERILSAFSKCSFNRRMVVNNLYHDYHTLYF